MKDFTIITGACGGLGRAFCEELAKTAHNLFLTGTNYEKTQAWAQELKQKYPEIDVDFCVCDLSDPQSRRDVFKTLEEKQITAERLINNGGFIAEGALLDFDDEKVLKIIRVNCEGTVDMTQKFIKMFGSGTEILTVSSLGAFYPMPYMSIYSSTKRMLVNLMVALRSEVKDKNIKVCTLCPGGIPSNEEMKKAIAAQGISGKLSAQSPEYIARYALKKLAKNKAIIIPGAFNRMLKVLGKPFSEVWVSKMVGKRWQKANAKRT